jgi:GntR family transcriptional regulator of arabinose operon
MKQNDEVVPQRPNKFRAISDNIREAIASGKYPIGQRVPSEMQLSRIFGASRLTVARALRELTTEGLLERKAGSGSYVRSTPGKDTRVFGLLVPELGETEIFESICQGIARASRSSHAELLWGAAPRGVESKEQQALQLCEYYIKKDVSGIFFAPLEFGPGKIKANTSILDNFERANIPVVLLDRDVASYPTRSGWDVVGIDNRRAGYIVTHQLLECSCKRIIFLARSDSAHTVHLREMGYREAINNSALKPRVEIGDPTSPAWLKKVVGLHKPDGFVCANDRTAGELMIHMASLGLEIPGRVKVIGIDDTKYATLLAVPLTTLRQPCHDIGVAAMWAMLERIEHPNTPARDIYLDCELIIRRSA